MCFVVPWDHHDDPTWRSTGTFSKDHERSWWKKCQVLKPNTKIGWEWKVSLFSLLKPQKEWNVTLLKAPKKRRGQWKVSTTFEVFLILWRFGFWCYYFHAMVVWFGVFFRFFDFIPVNCGWRQGLIMLIGWWRTVEFWPVAMVCSLTGFYFPKISSWSASMVLGNLTLNFKSKFHGILMELIPCGVTLEVWSLLDWPVMMWNTYFSIPKAKI